MANDEISERVEGNALDTQAQVSSASAEPTTEHVVDAVPTIDPMSATPIATQAREAVENTLPGGADHTMFDAMTTTPTYISETSNPIAGPNADIPVMKTAPISGETPLYIPDVSTSATTPAAHKETDVSAALDSMPEMPSVPVSVEAPKSSIDSGLARTAEVRTDAEVASKPLEKVTPDTASHNPSVPVDQSPSVEPIASASSETSGSTPIVKETEKMNPIKGLLRRIRMGFLGERAMEIDEQVQSLRNKL